MKTYSFKRIFLLRKSGREKSRKQAVWFMPRSRMVCDFWAYSELLVLDGCYLRNRVADTNCFVVSGEVDSRNAEMKKAR